MPLRARLIVLVGLVLLASLGGGAMLVAWHAARSVQIELRAALDVGAQSVRNAFDDMADSQDRAADLRHLIATFDGNRHVRATLLDDKDQLVAASRLLSPSQAIPRWFRRVIGGSPHIVRLGVPQSAASVVLQTDSTNEVGEVWGESRDSVLVLTGFALLSAVLISAAVGRALRPLETLSLAFARIGKGDFDGKVPERGPPELARLAQGFNLMTQRLATVAAQNQRLNERLLTLQAEERADLARDLHDEIGPLLFAVDMTAATIERLADANRAADIRGQVRSIHDAVGRMQRHVRAILERLRPLRTAGIKTAIDRLIAFWRNRRPEIDFVVTISIEEDQAGDDVKETIYRVVQEAVSNAIRHGNPARIEIIVARDAEEGIRVEVSDDGAGMPADRASESVSSRFGLIGMRERVMAMAGSLSIRHGRDGKGLALVARLPTGQDTAE